MWIYQGVEQDMRKKTKRIFDDIIIGLKGKDALACLESLEKIQKDFLQDRDSLEGIQKKIDSYPLRYRIIYKGFCNQWSLAELNAALQEKSCRSANLKAVVLMMDFLLMGSMAPIQRFLLHVWKTMCR